MRSALYKFPFVLLLIGVAHCQGPPPQMVNPHTQIRWPLLCNQPGQTYVFQTNTCMQVGPIGNNGDVQLNNGGSWGTAPGLYYDYATNTMHFTNVNISGSSNVIVPPTQVTWPPSCSSGVYVPSSNTCVPPGTAANPAGASGEAQINMGGIFNAIAGSAPLNTNGMQYQGPLQSPNLIATTSVNAPAAIGYRQNAGAAGVPSTAIAHNRDQTTAMFATPQDFCPNSGSGPPFDDTDCFNRAIRWLASQNNNASKTLYVPWTPNGYYLPKEGAEFLYTLPYDLGDYHGSAGFTTQASASVYFSGGKLTSCAIQGGSGYAPSAQLPIQILDPQHLGSGAVATVLTDASGIPASTCVIQLAGMNYPQVGVLANVIPLGGDGATGTCALSGGTFSSPCTVATGGSGYLNTLKPPTGMAGLTCGTLPVLTTTITGTSVSAVTTTAGATCVYGQLSTPVNAAFSTVTAGGSLAPATYYYRVAALDASGSTLASTETSMVVPAGTSTNTVTVNWGAVANAPFNSATSYKVYGRTTGAEQLIGTVSAPTTTFTDDGTVTPSGALPSPNTTGLTSGTIAMQFGASCGGAQCTLLSPETPINIPLSVALLNGVQIVGIGNPAINTNYFFQNLTAPSLLENIAFGDPWGDQSGGMRADLTGSDMSSRSNQGPIVRNITVNAQIVFAFPLLANGTFDTVTCKGGMCFYIGQMQQSNSGAFRGDTKFTNDTFLGVSGILAGGDWHSRGPDSFAGGNYGGTWFAHNPLNSGIDSTLYGATGGIDIEDLYASFIASSSAAWDVWVERYIWKAQNSPAVPKTDATHFLSNLTGGGTGTCNLGSGLAFASRATDNNFGTTSYFSYPWLMCYRGIGQGAVSALPRYGSQLFTSSLAGLSNINYTFTLHGARINTPWRPVWFGYAQMVDVRDVWTQTPIATADPYLPAGATACAGVPCTNAVIWMANNTLNTLSMGKFEGISNPSTTVPSLRSTYFGLSAAADTSNFANSSLFVRSVIGGTAATTFPDQSTGSVVTANLTTTFPAITSDTVALTGYTFRGRCQLTPTNALAATNIATTYISARINGQITVTHVATAAAMTYDVSCTKYF